MPSESLTWQLCPVVRASFHAVLHSGIDAVSLAAAMQEFSQTVEGLRQAHQLLTASLFRYQAHLFLYLESVGTALPPDGLSPLLDALLCPWPDAMGEALPRRWIAIQPYFYHDCLLLASLPRLWRKTSELTAIAAFSLCCNDLLVESLRYAFAAF